VASTLPKQRAAEETTSVVAATAARPARWRAAEAG